MKARKRRPLSERFWEKVSRTRGCWLWKGAASSYGHMGGGDGRTLDAHRVAWELAHGPIPTGLWVLHRCDNPKCVNPSHLFLGTRSDNMRDAFEKGRGAIPRHYGAEVKGAKLTDERVREIRLLACSGMSQSELARRFGVCQTNISRILKRKAWAHVA